MATRARRSINIKDGRLVMRTEATDALRGLYRPIPDDVAKVITDGKISAKSVVSAIMKRERFSADDSDSWWDQFKKDEEALNIRRTKVDFGADDDGVEKKELPADDPKDMISLKELGVKTSKTEKNVEADATGVKTVAVEQKKSDVSLF